MHRATYDAFLDELSQIQMMEKEAMSFRRKAVARLFGRKGGALRHATKAVDTGKTAVTGVHNTLERGAHGVHQAVHRVHGRLPHKVRHGLHYVGHALEVNNPAAFAHNVGHLVGH